MTHETHSGRFHDVFATVGFKPFLTTQFLGALNDNVFKMIVSLAIVGAVAVEQQARYRSLAQALFILPFLLFSGYAGHMADVYSKKRVLVGVKSFEIVAMLAACAALAAGDVRWMLAVLFLMSLQSTFFSPAKFGILPEMLPETRLSRGNGLVNMTTFLAIVSGTAIGGLLFSQWTGQLWLIGLLLTAVAAAGFAASFFIADVPTPSSKKPFNWNPWGEIAEGVKRLRSDRNLWLAVLGSCYFWFIGALLQISFLSYGSEILRADEFGVSLLLTAVAAGIGTGSLIAGRLSGEKVELGLVPIGAAGLSVFLTVLGLGSWSYGASAVLMALAGASAGLFVVPLEAFIQQQSGANERGRILAAANFATTAAILLAAGVTWLLQGLVGLSASNVIAIGGLFTLIATLVVMNLVPHYMIRFALWMTTHVFYRINIVGRDNIPQKGPALLISNHVSFVDGFLVGGCVQRFVRFLIYKPHFERQPYRWVLERMNAIPIEAKNKEVVDQAIATARQELEAGHVVTIFAEGAISRTGEMQEFRPGFRRIAEGLDVPIIPVQLHGVWGSIFSFSDGKVFKKLPKRIPYPVTVSFGAPLASDASVEDVRTAVEALTPRAVQHPVRA